MPKNLADKIECPIFALEIKGTIAQLNRVSDYGSDGSRFESWWCHKRLLRQCRDSLFYKGIKVVIRLKTKS